MIKVTVLAMPLRNQKGIGKTSMKAYDMDFQTIYFHLTDKSGNPMPFPEKSEIILDRDKLTGQTTPFKPGEYQLAPSSFYLDQRGSLVVSPHLIPLVKAA